MPSWTRTIGVLPRFRGTTASLGQHPEVVVVALGAEVDAQTEGVQRVGAEASTLVAVDCRLDRAPPHEHQVMEPVRVVGGEPGLHLGERPGDLQHLARLVGRPADEEHPRHAADGRLASPWQHLHRPGTCLEHPAGGLDGEHGTDDGSDADREPDFTRSEEERHCTPEPESAGRHCPEQDRPERVPQRRGLPGDAGPELGVSWIDARTIPIRGPDPRGHGERTGQRCEEEGRGNHRRGAASLSRRGGPTSSRRPGTPADRAKSAAHRVSP